MVKKKGDPLSWDGDVWKDPIEAENLNPQILKGLSHLRKQSPHPQQMYSHPHPLKYCIFQYLTKEINPSLSAKQQ